MNLLLGLSFLLLASPRRSLAQDDSLAGSFLSGRTGQKSNKKGPIYCYWIYHQLECGVCCYVCLRNGIFRNLIYANRPISFSFFLLEWDSLIELFWLKSVFITFIYIQCWKEIEWLPFIASPFWHNDSVFVWLVMVWNFLNTTAWEVANA